MSAGTNFSHTCSTGLSTGYQFTKEQKKRQRKVIDILVDVIENNKNGSKIFNIWASQGALPHDRRHHSLNIQSV